jgi:hypothetical protein
MKYSGLLIIVLLILSSCKDDCNAEGAAKDFCNCMKENGSPEQYLLASKVCDGELIKKNRFYKLFYVDMANRDLDQKVSKTTRDSVQQFMGDFMDYLNKNCCKETLRCPIDSTVVM